MYDCLRNSKDIIENSASYLMSSRSSDENVFLLEDVRLETKKPKQSNFIDLNDKGEKVILLYNSNINERHEIVSFKVNTPHVEVFDSTGSPLANVQVSLIWPNVEGTTLVELQTERLSNGKDLKFGFDFDTNAFELLFQVKLEPLALTSFTIKKSSSNQNGSKEANKVTFYHLNHSPDQVRPAREQALNK